ncbi:MAG: hypothetical protein ACREE0_05690 [Phenylobacterium sp.]
MTASAQTQHQLSQPYAHEHGRSRRAWSARRTLTFILVTCGLFWATAISLALR